MNNVLSVYQTFKLGSIIKWETTDEIFFQLIPDETSFKDSHYKLGEKDLSSGKEYACIRIFDFPKLLSLYPFSTYTRIVFMKIPNEEDVYAGFDNTIKCNIFETDHVEITAILDLSSVMAWDALFSYRLCIANLDNYNKILSYVSEKGFIDALKFILDYHREYGNFRDSNIYNIIKPAIKNNHIHIIKFMLDKTEYDNVEDRLCIRLAIQCKNKVAIQLFLRYGSCIQHIHLFDATDNEMYDMIAEYIIANVAADQGIISTLKEIKDSFKYVSIKDSYGLLWRAAKNGHLSAVKFLIENGADLVEVGEKAIKYALENEHTDVVDYLISARKTH